MPRARGALAAYLRCNGGMTTTATSAPTVTVGTGPVSFDDVVAVARHDAPVEISPESLGRGAPHPRGHRGAGRRHGTPHYGVSTGFGALATRHIPVELRAQLQRSLVRSHAAGSGAEVEREVVRALMLLRISTLATGRTGIREETLQTYVAMLNAGITPVVHEYGSLGCSGDLAPLSHCALALMGEGVVRDAAGERMADGRRVRGGRASRPSSCARRRAWPSSTAPTACSACSSSRSPTCAMLLRTADITAAMSVEGQLGTDDVFAADLHALRPQPGQALSAANLRKIMQDSGIRDSHRDPEACTRVQDAYSLRCSPQVAGGAPRHRRARRDGRRLRARLRRRQPRRHPRRPGRVQRQLPRCAGGLRARLPRDRRRRPRLDLRAPHRPLPRRLAQPRAATPFLADDPGVDSGHMIAQYTQAAIVSELKRLAVPASVDSIPSSAMQEDHVSMGWSAARKLRRSVDGLTRVLAVELLTAARAIDLRAPLTPAPATGAVVAALRDAGAPAPGTDRFLAPEIEVAVQLVASGAAVAAAESVTGPLN